MMEPQGVELEDDSINFWASLGVSTHVHGVDQMALHNVHILDHQGQSLPPSMVSHPESVCKELFPVEADPCLEPRVGMEFESGEAAKTFYIAYAGRVGFSVRIARSRKSKCSESIIMLRFVCSKEGFSKEKRVVAGKKTRKRLASIREGCNAMLEVLRRGDNKWVATKLVKEHNHEVGMPSTVHYIATETDTMVDPYIDMEFESLESAKTFYYSYAIRAGFEVRVRQSRKSQDESLKMLKLVCSKHRYHSGRENNGEDTKRDPSRDGCNALFEIIRKDKSVWRVSKLILEHTHELNPAPASSVCCVRSQGEILVIAKNFADTRNLLLNGQDSQPRREIRYNDLGPEDAQSLLEYLQKVAVQQLEQAICNFHAKETQADYLTMFQLPALRTASPVEKQAERLEDRMLHKYRLTVDDGDEEAHIVSFSPDQSTVCCSCCLFESCGILCRHALRVFIIEGVRFLPKAYVLKRWTKHAKSTVTLDNYIELRGYCEDPSTSRYNDLCYDAIKCAKEGSTSTERYKIAKEALRKALDEIMPIRNIREQISQNCTSLQSPVKKFGAANGTSGKSIKRPALKNSLVESNGSR
ncbi:hypothetical protein ZWY2020_039103 [Hordeum vulgare]|nr:hypothetical protein ZWY2020_039103 [Hordeum vulgare]